jgi:hypothetical protein
MNALYEGKTLSEDELYRLLALYRLEFLEYSEIMDTMRSKPVYLGLAMNADRKLVMKPQNLLTNLPLMATS